MTEKLETPTLAEVVDAFHTLFPPQLAAGWDASGLVAGRGAAKVSTVLFAVDALTATAEEAVAEGAQLLITHHPLLLRGAKFIPDSDYKGNVLHTLIEGGCGLLGAHTNADAAVEGVNEALCDAIGLIDREPLTEAQTQVLDEQEHAVGTGRLGTLPEEITLKELAERLAAALPATAGGLRIAGRTDQPIRRVALCGGAGDSLFDAVRATDAQVYITADLRHHPASEFRETARVDGSNIALIDCSHAASESLWLQSAANRLRSMLAERGFTIETKLSALNTDPWDFTVSTGVATGQDAHSASTEPAATWTSLTEK